MSAKPPDRPEEDAAARAQRVAAAEGQAALHRLAQTASEALLDLLAVAGIDSRSDLAGANLSGASLPGEDLSGADLSEADLSGAVLKGAQLEGASLRGATADAADLTRADLRDADCRGASFRGACLANAQVQGADFTGADLTGADLTGTGLEAEFGQAPPSGDREDDQTRGVGGLRFPMEAMDTFRDGLLWRLVDMGRGDTEMLDFIESAADDLAQRQDLIAQRARLRADGDRGPTGDLLLARASRDLGLMHWRLGERAAADQLFEEAGSLWDARGNRDGRADMAFARACLSLLEGDRQSAGVILAGLRGGPDLMPRIWAARALLAMEEADPMRARDAIDSAGAFPDHAFAEELRSIGQFLKAALIAGAGGQADLDQLAYATPRTVAMREPYRSLLSAMRS